MHILYCVKKVCNLFYACVNVFFDAFWVQTSTISKCDIISFTFDWQPQWIMECIFFFNVDFISWMVFEIIIKLIVSIDFTFILYEWLHTLGIVREWLTKWYHLFAFSLALSLHSNCWLVVFFIAYFVNKERNRSDKQNNDGKKCLELLNLISKTIDIYAIISTSQKRVIAN